MENFESDDDFRSYMTDFQSYLHNIGDLGPIEPPTVDAVNAIVSPSDAAESSINWTVAMNKEEEQRMKGRVETNEERRLPMAEEEDEDRIVAEGCDLDCSANDPDLISDQRHSGWYPDVTREGDDEVHRPEVAEEDLEGTGSDEDSKCLKWKSVEEPLNIEGEREDETHAGLRGSDLERNVGQAQEQGKTGICDDDPLEYLNKTSSTIVDENATWRYSGDDQIHLETEEEVWEKVVRTDDDLNITGLKNSTEEKECSPIEVSNQRQLDDEVLVDFGETKTNAQDGAESWQGHGFRDEMISEGEVREEEEEEEEEEDGRKMTAAAAIVESHDAQSLVSDADVAGNGKDANDFVNDIHPESYPEATDSFETPPASSTFQAREQGLRKDSEEEKAYVEEQEAKYWEEKARLMTSSADEENRNTLIGDDKINESTSDVNPTLNGAQMRIYPSQVRKTNHFLSGESESQSMDTGAPDDILSPGENEEDGEQRGLPEQGQVKSLLAQWRQMEQQKKKPGAARDEDEHQQRHRQPISSGWSQATPEDDDEIQPTRSRVRDEILRMRSQSCDPMASRKNSRLSPNDDDVPSVGKRVGRGRTRMEEEGDEEADDNEHYRSQPSITKAIMAKFENLDLQAASSAIKPKSNKNFKWQVKETTRFCRPGFVPRSGR